MGAEFRDFYALLAERVGEDERLMACQFRGDPEGADFAAWRARPIRDPEAIDERANVYLCVSAMKRNAEGHFRRTLDCFAAGLLLMIDDVGTKVLRSVVDILPPTAMVETSPANFQALYVFREPEPDSVKFDSLVKAFIASGWLKGKDSGMGGINRVFRPPVGVNGKAKYRDPETGEAWPVRMTEWAPERLFSVDEIAAQFGLSLRPRLPPPPARPVSLGVALGERALGQAYFDATLRRLSQLGALKSHEANAAGWREMTCPWVGDHTGGADNGAALREPGPFVDEFGIERTHWGAFRCHHGGCRGRGWEEMTDWLHEINAEALADANNKAQDTP